MNSLPNIFLESSIRIIFLKNRTVKRYTVIFFKISFSHYIRIYSEFGFIHHKKAEENL